MAKSSDPFALAARNSAELSSAPPRVPVHSPLALFAPEHYLTSPVPAPLYLLEFVPGTLANFYPTNPDGTLRDREHYFHERTITYATGAMIRVQAVASPRFGLPMQHDADILLALLRMVDSGAASDDGTFIQPSYRAILRTAGRDVLGRDAITAVKRALARWTVSVRTEASIDFHELATQIEARRAPGRVPSGAPDRATRTNAYSVLEYSVDTETRKDHTVDTIGHLRINPVWLSQSRAGIAAWIDVDTHNVLRSPWAKRIYQHLAARAAVGWRPQELMALTLAQFVDGLAVRSGRRSSEDAEQVRTALNVLQAHGVVAYSAVRRLKKGQYEVVIEGGERLIGASHLRGTTSRESPFSRVLLAHLEAYGINAQDSADLIAKSPAQVLAVLRRLYWLQSTSARDRAGIKPAVHPAKFIKSAIANGYLFEEPIYQQWLAMQSKAALARPEARQIVAHADARGRRAEEPPQALQYPNDVWGRAVNSLYQAGALPLGAVLGYLLRTRLVASSDRTVVVQAPDSFGADWIKQKYYTALVDALSDEVGARVQLTISAADLTR